MIDTLILAALYLVVHLCAMRQVRKNHSKGIRRPKY